MGGKVITDFFSVPGGFQASDDAWALAIDSNDRIVLAGNSFTSGQSLSSDFSLARYNSDGSLDPTFDGDGKLATDLGSPQDTAFAVTLQSDGKIIAAGRTFEDPPVRGNFALVRYLTDGGLDPTFGTGGQVITDFSGRSDGIRDIDLLPDGRVIAAGVSFGEFFSDTALAQYLTNGELALSFGSGGKIVASLSTGDDSANSLALQADGKIVTAGQSFSFPTQPDFAVARFNGSTTFDICLQDDRVGNSLLINSATGDYVFNNCDTNSSLSGRGAITVQGCVVTLSHRAPDRNLRASINTCLRRGDAVVSLFSPGLFGFTGIDDSDNGDNTCACR